jgi:hypothetical protein
MEKYQVVIYLDWFAGGRVATTKHYSPFIHGNLEDAQAEADNVDVVALCTIEVVEG